MTLPYKHIRRSCHNHQPDNRVPGSEHSLTACAEGTGQGTDCVVHSMTAGDHRDAHIELAWCTTANHKHCKGTRSRMLALPFKLPHSALLMYKGGGSKFVVVLQMN